MQSAESTLVRAKMFIVSLLIFALLNGVPEAQVGSGTMPPAKVYPKPATLLKAGNP